MFNDQPNKGATTHSTLGLSRHVLAMGDGCAGVRQELVVSVLENSDESAMCSLLFNVAQEIVIQHRAVLHGEVLRLNAPVVPLSKCICLYASMPVLFPDEFAVCRDVEPHAVFVWLVPITGDEAGFVANSGWSRFEDLLENK